MEPTLRNECDELRAMLLDIEKRVRLLMNHGDFNSEQSRAGQHSEMKANIMLAVRHTEDARMRLGKCIQHSETGVSCFDK